ncbi:NAD-P-binding protein [Epithele typhae]|uniref:NAD-P-binding protein n=1 Tax=Epithele typhae TaxID=378194 RepID=UPI0020084AF9|nr:NAD-P-binding protein [Epithele typhae]KAH9930401.1 NAD-P-binding protein [Epithele typhae]
MDSLAPTVWFITGANRGIGLELVNQLLQSPSNEVFGACRNPVDAASLHALAGPGKGTLHIIALDINDSASIEAAAAEAKAALGERGIDYLINNAGINPGWGDSPPVMTVDNMLAAFRTNVIGPALMVQTFAPLVARGGKKAIVNVSSTMGSIASRKPQNQHSSYSISKAALNMLTGKLADSYPDLTVIVMCPGWLETDMGGAGAGQLPVSTGVGGIIKVAQGLKHEDSGSFIEYTGKRVPW